MKRKLWKLICPTALLVMLIVLTLALAVPASAATYESSTAINVVQVFTVSPMGQTFTATSAHTVNAVSLLLGRESGATGTFSVSIYGTSNGARYGEPLISPSIINLADLPGPGVVNWVTIPLSGSLPLMTGKMYAIQLDRETLDDIEWGRNTVDSYPGGAAYPFGGDFNFIIYGESTEVTAYSLTVATNPASIDSTTGSGNYLPGATVPISAPENVDIVAGQSRYHFSGWTGTGVAFADASAYSTTMTMPSSATTVTANYVTQYNIHYAVTGNTQTINVPADAWVNSGSGAIGSFPAQVTNTAGNIRDNFVSDDRPAVTIGITGPTTVTATYQTQYLVHYATTGAVLTVTVPTDEWVNSGAAATGAFPLQVVNNAGNTRCSYVSDNRPAVPTGVIAPITVTATYQTQYYVVLDLRRGFDSAKTDGIGTVLKVNGSEFTVHDLPFSAWFSAGSSLNYEFTEVIDGAPGVKYGWVHNGGVNYLTERASNIQVNAYTVTQAMYLSYAVTVSPGSGQYSDNVSFTAQVGPYVPSMFAYPTDVHFYVGTQEIGSVDLSPSADGTYHVRRLFKCSSARNSGRAIGCRWQSSSRQVGQP